MSESNLQQVMTRISGATPESQIAVFRTGHPEKLNAVFSSTVVTQKMISDKDHKFIGTYDRTMDLQKIKRTLSGYVQSAALTPC